MTTHAPFTRAERKARQAAKTFEVIPARRSRAIDRHPLRRGPLQAFIPLPHEGPKAHRYGLEPQVTRPWGSGKDMEHTVCTPRIMRAVLAEATHQHHGALERFRL